MANSEISLAQSVMQAIESTVRTELVEVQRRAMSNRAKCSSNWIYYYVSKYAALPFDRLRANGTFADNFKRILIASTVICLYACTPSPPAPNASQVQPQSQLAAPAIALPEVLVYQKLLLDNPLPALPLELSGEAAAAQTLALAHAPLAAQLQMQGNKLRAEVMAVYPLRITDVRPDIESCRLNRCYRVEVYDFARNTTLVGTVDLTVRRILNWRADAGRQAEVPMRLKNLAINLAISSNEVREALGGIAPKFSDAQMASTKSALNNTRCERSKHLCVAPTFVQGNIAIWAIVDLTDFKLVGVQWTNVGERAEAAQTAPPTEQSLSDAAITANFCEKNTVLERLGWKLDYLLTASDGLQISDVSFQGKPLLSSAKLVDWHVSYSERDGFGYSDAVGCPSFSSAAVLPFTAPSVTEIIENGKTTGVKLEQEFRSLGWPGACNYSYRQSFEFYADGRFRPTAGSIGAGCGNDGMYRPVMRIEPDGKNWAFETHNQDRFEPVLLERYFDANGATDATGARFRLKNSAFEFQIEPGRGQFALGRGDNEWVYVTTNKPGRDEGSSDLLTIGPCCNKDFRQGPEIFLDAQPEALNGSLVFWYVPQLKNDDRPGQEYCWARNQIVDGVIKAQAFPCIGGPMFRPIIPSAIAP